MSLPSALPIAFNRRLRAAWLREGLRLLAEDQTGAGWRENMEALVRAENRGRDSVTKSMRYLRQIWLEPGARESCRREAVRLYRERSGEADATLLCWGMAMVTYPFLEEVAATLARLLRVQPEVKLEQLLRRLQETHGERETVRRSTRYALGLMTDFGFVQRTGAAGCYRAGPLCPANRPAMAAWFLRAWATASASGPVFDRVSLASAPGLAWFDGPRLVADAVTAGALVPGLQSSVQEVLHLRHGMT